MEVIHKISVQHSHIVVLQSVIEREIAVVVNDVGPRSDLVDNGVLLVNAYDMLNSLSFEILVASSPKELIVANKPAENFFMSVPRTLKERILTKIVLSFKSLKLVIGEDLEHLKVFALSSNEDWRLAFEIRCQAAVRLQVV